MRLFVLLFWRHGVEWACDVIADVDNGCGQCIIPTGGEIYAWNARFDWRLILSCFLDCIILHVIKGTKYGCQCIVELRPLTRLRHVQGLRPRHNPACFHDDVIKCQKIPRYWPFARGIHRSPVSSPHKARIYDVFFDLRLNKRLINNREAGDLRRPLGHYDVNVMSDIFNARATILNPFDINVCILYFEDMR